MVLNMVLSVGVLWTVLGLPVFAIEFLSGKLDLDGRSVPMIKIAILGGSGYTALELIQILLRHPAAEIVAVTSRQEGTPLVAELHPALAGRVDLRCEPFDADRLLAKGVACAFGCLPHAASMQTLPRLLERGVRVIDLSADYRLRDPNGDAQWYGHAH